MQKAIGRQDAKDAKDAKKK
jgi:hypothetical protein